MIKAVVFDDEYIVLEALGALIDWKGLGIELAGTAMDGISALETFRSVRPEIVLTDIRMPGKDGLRLVEEIMEEAPDTCCVVFSGYNEFEYVKNAIRLGVTDYVEKPITETSIERALRKVLGQIGRNEEIRTLERRIEETRRELLEKAVWDLLRFGKEAEAKWRDCFGQEAGRVCGVTVLAAKEAFTLPVHAAYRTVFLRSERERLAVVFHFMALPQSYWDDIASDLDTAGVTAGIGTTAADPAGADRSYSEAQRALKSALLLGLKGAVRFSEPGDWSASPDSLAERAESVILSLRAGSRALFLEQVDRFLDGIREAKADPDVAEHEMLRLIYAASEAVKEAGGPLNDAPQEPCVPHIEIREAAERGAAPDWFRERIEAIADGGMKLREQSKHTAVEKARLYIERHISRDVSLQEAAEHAGLNATYFSVLFKEVMGETYIKYVTRCRMELAKTLLRKGYKVGEVSEKVGYLTHRHFSEVFKKHTGLTPGQFKEGL
ncbi:helix-turn-helix domain-containing protein [Paenibacillus humicola]|uniref:helix-turn-helix domain-containing protein n=1 Tax=Paenibacillus humicola TaxID=3110540 RepID=UPI00237C3E50|nr:helix-turn-helix domain-containing protein [Paenibacillus humicola]